MQNSTSSVEQIIKDTIVTIDNREKEVKTIVNSIIVEKMLVDYQDLIHPDYKSWFAKRFYCLPMDQIHAAGQQARQNADNPQRYFTRTITNLYLKAGATKGGFQTPASKV